MLKYEMKKYVVIMLNKAQSEKHFSLIDMCGVYCVVKSILKNLQLKWMIYECWSLWHKLWIKSILAAFRRFYLKLILAYDLIKLF